MSRRRFAFLLFILILVFSLVFPGVVLAENTSTTDMTSSAQQGNNHFKIEVTKNGFKNTSETTSGELRLEVKEGQEVEITFVYADDTSSDNPHIIYIGGYKIQTETLSKNNPEVTVKFTANKTGEFPISCIKECAGHQNLQSGKLVVFTATESGTESMPTVILALNAPDQTETGQSLTLVALVKDELDKPVAGAQVNFFVESDFFVKNLMKIGETVTNEQGLAKIDYIPNQAGVLRVVARYETDSNLGQVEIEREVNITGSNKSFYQTLVGIRFPNSFYIWMTMLAVVIIGVWGTFLYVLSQVLYISLGTGSKKLVIIIMVVVVVLCFILVQLLVTPEPQYHFGLLP